MRAHFRRLAPLSLCVVPALLYAGCSTDDEPLPAGGGGSQVVAGGASAAAGGAGKAGAGATAGTTGKGGSSATGGTTGTGGTSTTGGASGTGGGASGVGGSAGKAGGGAGGTTGGSAGAAGKSGNAGSAGTAGMGGTAGASAGSAGTAGNAGASGATAGSGGGGAAGAGGVAGAGGSAGWNSVGGSGGFGGGVTGMADDKAAILAMLTNACTDALSTIYDDATPPAWDPSHRGDVIRCAYDRLVPISEMSMHYASNAFADPGIYTDVHKLRITYWTERDVAVPPIGSAGAGGATSMPTPVLTSATLYIPAIRVAKPAPLIVFAHPTVGSADICAPSKEDPMGAQTDWRSKAYGLIGHGWTVLMPDMPGLGTSGTPAWQDSEDEAHTLLDGTRAMRKLAMASLVNDKNAFFGHSEGGHGVLAVQSYAAAYGSSGTVDALVAFAPVYFSQGAWGAELTPVAAAMKLYVPGVLGFATQYIYGHLSKYEGDSHRNDAFQPALAAQIDNVMQTQCGGLYQGVFDLAPNMKATDLYTSAYTGEVGSCGAFGTCSGTTAAWWRDRWVADRPAADKTLPVVIWEGALDDEVTPDRQQCGVDRLTAQSAPLTVCGEPNADHSTIVASIAAGEWTEQYLYAKTLGGALPSACGPMVRADGTKPVCPALPKNSVLPTDP